MELPAAGVFSLGSAGMEAEVITVAHSLELH